MLAWGVFHSLVTDMSVSGNCLHLSLLHDVSVSGRGVRLFCLLHLHALPDPLVEWK